MNQYTPMYNAKKYKEINRELKVFEYDRFIDYALEIGVESAFIQEKKDDGVYTPNFGLEGV